MVTAYADESMRTLDGESVYLLGATVFRGDDCQLDALVGLKTNGAKKLHWRELGRVVQAKVMRAVSSLTAITTVVIGVPMNPRKQERARRKCLESLIYFLVDDGIQELVLEARGPALDKRDIQLVDTLKSRGYARNLTVRHRNGADDPRLWVPDQVLGAFGDRLCAQDFDSEWEEAWHDLERVTRFEIIDL